MPAWMSFASTSHTARTRDTRTLIARVRAAARQSSRTIALLQDLSGPKIRTGLLHGHAPLQLEVGDALTIAVGDFAGEPGRVSTTFDLPSVVHPGDCLLLDDGRLQLRVEEVGKGELQTRVVDGGPLGEHKGINVPGVEFPATGLTDEGHRRSAIRRQRRAWISWR